MAIKIESKPVELEYQLKSDPDGEARVTVRQATTGDQIRLASLFQNQRQVWNDAVIGEVAIEKKFNFPELKRMRAFLTITNVVGITDFAGRELFEFSETMPRRFKSEQHFNEIWNSLPAELSDEIYQAVLKANPQWDENAGN